MTLARRVFRGLMGMAATAMLVLVSHPANCQTVLPEARDFAADAVEAARAREPMIVMFSLKGCPHCEVVRRSYLLPLLREQTAQARPILRQVEINGNATLRDFDGSTTTHAEFAARYKIRIAPVVMFLGPKGELLAKSLVGAMIPDFYGSYLDAALAEARAKLAP